jgi:HAD superfamily hydrolase (TIGR01509 family)
MDTKTIELVIFDMDGLMFDSEKISIYAWRKASEKYGYDITEEIFKQTLGLNLEKIREIFCKFFSEDCPYDDIKTQRRYVIDQYIDENGVPAKKGLFNLLELLKKLNIKTAVATSSSRATAEKMLILSEVLPYFDYIVCGDEVKKSKPDPEIFLIAADKLKCLPENCIVLEDSEAGIMAAYSAGMRPLLVPDMKMPSDEVRELAFKVFTDLDEVKDFIAAMSK